LVVLVETPFINLSGLLLLNFYSLRSLKFIYIALPTYYTPCLISSACFPILFIEEAKSSY
jgi:hypothetical protein